MRSINSATSLRTLLQSAALSENCEIIAAYAAYLSSEHANRAKEAQKAAQ